jgi:hypothetical protein
MKRAEPHLRYEYNEFHRFDTLLKHATMSLQFMTQAIDGLREVVGTGVLYADAGRGRRRARPKRIASAKAMLTLRERARQSEAKEAGRAEPKPKKPHQLARQRGRKAGRAAR